MRRVSTYLVAGHGLHQSVPLCGRKEEVAFPLEDLKRLGSWKQGACRSSDHLAIGFVPNSATALDTLLTSESGLGCSDLLRKRLPDERWPELAQFPRQDANELYDLATVDALRENIENGADAAFNLDGIGPAQFLRNVLEEFDLVPLFARGSGHMPAFVIEAAQQHRKLRAEMAGIGWSEAVTQGVPAAATEAPVHALGAPPGAPGEGGRRRRRRRRRRSGGTGGPVPPG